MNDNGMNEKLQRRTDRVIWASAIAFLITLVADQVIAATPATTTRDVPATYRTECGACHVAYPPKLLPAESWLAVIRGLDKHFGTDASLDAPTAAAISRWLAANASTRAPAGTTLRITDTPWFRHEHDEISRATWQRKAIGSPSNCAACHTRAEQGRFSEHDIRIPAEEPTR